MIDLVCFIVKKYKYYFEKTPLKFELRALKQLCDVDQF